MAVAHDAQTRFPATDTTGLDATAGTRTFSHPGSASATGAVVVICADATAAPVTGVLYGGVAMTLKQSVIDSTEAGCVYIYVLTSGVPTGTQTVTLQGCTTANKFATCSTVTSGGAAVEVSQWFGLNTQLGTGKPTVIRTALPGGRPCWRKVGPAVSPIWARVQGVLLSSAPAVQETCDTSGVL